MKRLVIFLFASFLSIAMFGQYEYPMPTVNLHNSESAYLLYPTHFEWTFLKLDTRTGEMWIVQFSEKEDGNRVQYPLSLTDLTGEEQGEKAVGRFALYPTVIPYYYMLMDLKTGKVWQVRWSNNKNVRRVIEIEADYNK